jgi:hypothetical protein
MFFPLRIYYYMIIKMISGSAWFNKSSPSGRKNVFVFAVILTAAVFFTGCSKSKPPVTQATVVPDTNQVAEDHAPVYQPPAAVAPTVAPTVAAAPASGAPDLKELDRGLIRWIVGNRRPPKNFADFAATAGVPIPPPPAGKIYIIDKTMHIQLVDR